MRWLKSFLLIIGCLTFFWALAGDEEDYRKQLKEYNNLFFTAFNQGYNYKAREYAGKALIVAIRAGLQHDVAMANSNLAIINTRMGDYEKANLNNFTALRIFKEMNDTLHIARCNLSIGTVYIKLKEYKKALNYITEAMDAFYRLNNMLGYSICLSNTGSIYMETEDYKKALPVFFEAVGIDEKSNDLSGTSSNFTDIGVVYLNLGNNKAASEYLRKALAIDVQTGDISGLANVNLNLARLMLKTAKIDSALYYCRAGERYNRESGQRSGTADVYAMFADIYEKSGDYKQAYQYYTKAADLNDSLVNIEKTARISMLEEKYINEKLSTRILSLEYRNNLQETKLKNQRTLAITWLTALILAAVAIVIIVVQLRNKNSAYKYIVSKNIDLMRKEKELYSVKDQLTYLKQHQEKQQLEKQQQQKQQQEQQHTADLKNAPEESHDPAEEVHEERHRAALSDDERNRLLEKLKEALQTDKIYTRADLTIDKLARKLATNGLPFTRYK